LPGAIYSPGNMDVIKRLITGLLIGCLPGALPAQDLHRIDRAYPGMTLAELFAALETNSGLKFFYRQEWIDTLTVSRIEEGSRVDRVLRAVLEGKGLNLYQEGNDLYIYPGAAIVSELPSFEEVKTGEEEVPSDQEEAKQPDDQYLQTKRISEENFITVGSPGALKNGDRCQVKGSIRNKRNGEALVGAVVFIQEPGTGTITDANGEFKLSLRPGEYTIVVHHMAMKETQYGLKVISDGEILLELEDELIALEEVTVSDQRRSNVQGMLMGFERISTKSMKEIPAVLGEKDILKVAQMLPGVQNAGEGSSGFNVRGGTADQNMFYINNISIYNTSHLFGFFTAFSPDIISDFSLYKNNVPSRYGGRIASIFDINTRPGNNRNFFAQGGISPITGHASVEGPIIREKVSFVASWRSTYSDWLLKRIEDQDIKESNAYFYDGTLGLNAEINPSNQVRAFFYMSNDRFSLSNRNDYSYSTMGGSINWNHRFSPSLSTDLSVASSRYSFRNIDLNNPTEAYQQEYYVNHTEARVDFLSTRLENHRIEFGLNSILYDLNRGEIIPYGAASKRIPVALGREQGVESALYLSDEFRIVPRLNALLGLRYSFYGQLGPSEVQEYEEGLPKNRFTMLGTLSYERGDLVRSYSGIEPRVALNYELGRNSSLKASYNRLRQYIFLLSNTFAIAPNDQWKLTDYHIRPPVSDQVSLGVYHDFERPGVSASVEVYQKWVNDVVEYKDGADFLSAEPIETQVLQGHQDARGVEVMLKKNTRRITGWMSYTYSRSTILIDGKYEEDRVNGGVAYPSNFDRPHSFNLVGNLRLSRRFSVSSNVVYSSGRPVTLPIAVYYAEGQEYLYYSDRNKYRIPDYFRVDLSVNLEGNLKFKKIAHSYWMLNIYNVTGRDNAYSVYYEAKEGQIKGYKLSIFAQPIVTLSWNFKLGNYNSD
jgi:hypothetical protein